jgi:outer membrane protein
MPGIICGIRPGIIPCIMPGILLGLLVLAPTLTGGAAARDMTLDDCVSTALGANRDIVDARENLDQARSGIVEARSGYLPNLSLSGSYNFMEKAQTVEFPLPGGGFEQTKLDFTRDYGLQLSLSQPLYTGGRLSGSYRISKISYDIAQADLERLEADVALKVIQAFYSYILAGESVAVAEEAIRTAEEFLRVVQARYAAGEASSFEVMRAEVEVSNLEPALISARNAVALADLALKNAMGVRLDDQLDFVGAFEENLAAAELGEAIARGLENRPELKMMRRSAEAADQSVRLAKAGRLPTFAISATYDMMSNDISLASDKWEKTYAGYLVMSLPVFDGLKTKSQIARSLSQARQARISIASLEDAVELEIRSSLLELEAARERLKSQGKGVEVAQEGLRIANDRYLQGLATNLDVMDAQLALTQARNLRLQALHDANLASATLERAMGILAGKYRVK